MRKTLLLVAIALLGVSLNAYAEKQPPGATIKKLLVEPPKTPFALQSEAISNLRKLLHTKIIPVSTCNSVHMGLQNYTPNQRTDWSVSRNCLIDVPDQATITQINYFTNTSWVGVLDEESKSTMSFSEVTADKETWGGVGIGGCEKEVKITDPDGTLCSTKSVKRPDNAFVVNMRDWARLGPSADHESWYLLAGPVSVLQIQYTLP